MKYNVPSKNTLELLYEYEVGGGKSYYEKYLSKFTWPGGFSGPTIAIGVDCGYYTSQELTNIFSFLDETNLALVQGASNKTGQQGKIYTKTLRDAGITVEWEAAEHIFQTLTWPKFARLAENTFPGLNEFSPDAYGAIVSLVFNRGTSLSGSARTEMAKIKTLVPSKNYKQIAKCLRDMKRLWIGKNLDGLLKRREAEANLIERAN